MHYEGNTCYAQVVINSYSCYTFSTASQLLPTLDIITPWSILSQTDLSITDFWTSVKDPGEVEICRQGVEWSNYNKHVHFRVLKLYFW